MIDSERYSEELGRFEDFSNESDADRALFEQYLAGEEDLSLPERGDLREGIVVEIRSNELLVNVGAKRDGVVPQSDLSRLESSYISSLKEGDTVPVVVSKQTTDEGMLVLSISDALQKQDWLIAEKMLESGEIGTYEVIGYNKGGLLVNFGHLRGFVPASHVVGLPRNMSEGERNDQLEDITGQELPAKVIEVDRRRRRLVLSHRYAEREYRTQRKSELFEEMKVGDVVQGEVRSLRPFGAFVDIGGADGLLHVSEIGWTPVSHPRDVLKVGDVIQVEILRLDPDRNRIALSRKKLLPNPWESIEERYKPGETVLVTITRVVDFGAFAQLEPGVEGLIHISELADIAVAEPLRTIETGDRIPVKILRVDADRQRIGLSRRQADDIVGQELLESEGILPQERTVAEEEEQVQLEEQTQTEEQAQLEEQTQTEAQTEDSVQEEVDMHEQESEVESREEEEETANA
jgi:small subunit ribosomal protein S1